MKSVILATGLLAASAASAHVDCIGEVAGKAIVEISYTTVGTMGYPRNGSVKITTPNGVVAYDLRKEDTPQMFEWMSRDEKTIMVGITAYVETNYPVHVAYRGPGFEEATVKQLRDPKRRKVAGNEMIVWKGPGATGSDSWSMRDVVCSVMFDP